MCGKTPPDKKIFQCDFIRSLGCRVCMSTRAAAERRLAVAGRGGRITAGLPGARTLLKVLQRRSAEMCRICPLTSAAAALQSVTLLQVASAPIGPFNHDRT